jgi:hypothetical protein
LPLNCAEPRIVGAQQTAKRNWGCRPDLECKAVFLDASGTAHAGVCSPPRDERQIGDALQVGRVSVEGFDQDTYVRKTPRKPSPGNTLIPASEFPHAAPVGNDYYGAHQESYGGNPKSADKAERRDAGTGGFPAGMLRLSECIGLPREATCGVIAASGFNDCIKQMSHDERFDTDVCFRHFTAFAGMRACNAAAPCRDDYICVRPIEGYGTMEDAKRSFKKRRENLKHPPINYSEIIDAPAYDETNFGEQQPSEDWINGHDRRGYCIPPYFVFQFRSDGHPPP